MVKLVLLFGIAAFAATAATATTPIHAYEFNNSVSAVDGIGGANGSLLGGATINGGNLHLDGIDDWVSFGSHLVPTLGSPYSVFIRVNGFSTPGLHTEIISQGVSGGPGFYIGTNPSGLIRLTDNFAAAQVNLMFPSGWHDLLFSSDASGSRFYIDAALVFSSPFQAMTTGGGANTAFGKQYPPSAEFFRGDVDAIRIYDAAVLPVDVVAPGIPEPAIWGLMVAGFGMVGAALRRRKTSLAV